jgi:hypothetical protein
LVARFKAIIAVPSSGPHLDPAVKPDVTLEALRELKCELELHAGIRQELLKECPHLVISRRAVPHSEAELEAKLE